MRALIKKIDQSVLIIWGQQDAYVGPELAEPDRDWVSNYRVVRLENASHWVMADEPERVSELILEHLAEATRGD